jgi:hypothetical protein
MAFNDYPDPESAISDRWSRFPLEHCCTVTGLSNVNFAVQ